MSDNPQFKRTDKAIMQALISLLSKKSFEKITVQDILDETPVTRATFYAHYRDKYEIAEKMLDHFLETRNRVRKSLVSPTLELLKQSHPLDQDFARALMKIHTENVDLRKALASELEKEYLETSSGPTREIEARIYAQAYVEMYFSMMNSQFSDLLPENTYQIFISVALGILHLSNDMETRKFLEDKITKKLGIGRN